MVDVLDDKYRIARKEHKCSFCNGTIHKGEKYRWQKFVEDGIYEWKSHLKCNFVANQLYNYSNCDYDNGMTSEIFKEIIKEFYYEFIGSDDISLYDMIDIINKTLENKKLVHNKLNEYQLVNI